MRLRYRHCGGKPRHQVSGCTETTPIRVASQRTEDCNDNGEENTTGIAGYDDIT